MEDNHSNNISKSSLKRIYNLENINYNSLKRKINRYFLIKNSPHSIEAIYKLGFAKEDLFYIDYKDYKASHPDLISLSDEIQKLKYEYNEQKRQKCIELCKEVK